MIVPPNFSDKKITDLFHKDIRPNDHINYLNNFKNGPTTYDLKTVSQTRFREWLMDTPEYSEWSIWNMV